MADFYITEGDTLPVLNATLLNDSGTAVNLTNASSVRFHMRKIGSNKPTVVASATFVDKPNGKVRYTWVTGNTAKAGLYDAEFQVTYVGGTIETYPNHDFIKIEIKEHIA